MCGNHINLYFILQEESSSNESVVLANISEKTSGEYKCEVMGEGPAFRTAVANKTMKVIGKFF